MKTVKMVPSTITKSAFFEDAGYDGEEDGFVQHEPTGGKMFLVIDGNDCLVECVQRTYDEYDGWGTGVLFTLDNEEYEFKEVMDGENFILHIYK